MGVSLLFLLIDILNTCQYFLVSLGSCRFKNFALVVISSLCCPQESEGGWAVWVTCWQLRRLSSWVHIGIYYTHTHPHTHTPTHPHTYTYTYSRVTVVTVQNSLFLRVIYKLLYYFPCKQL